MLRDLSWFYLLVILAIGILFQNCAPLQQNESASSPTVNLQWHPLTIEGYYTEQLDGCGPVVCSNTVMSDGWNSCFRLQDATAKPAEGQNVRVEGLGQKQNGESEKVDACLSKMSVLRVSDWEPL